MQRRITPAVAAALALVAFSAAAQTAAPTSQTVIYPAQQPDHYLPSSAMQQYSDSYSSTIYSPSQYPTAQGHYLQVPGGYSQMGSATILPSAPATPPPSAAKYNLPYAPGAPPPPAPPPMPSSVTISPSPVDIPPRPSPLVYPQTTGTSLPPRPIVPPVSYNTYNPGPVYVASAGSAMPAPYPAAVPAATPNYAPAAPPVVAKPAAPVATPFAPASPADKISLGTGTGGEIGLQIFSYRYQEHVVPDPQFVSISGASFGLTGQASKTFTEGWLKDTFVEGQLDLNYGSHQYNGSIKKDGISDYMGDIRMLMGHDFIANNLWWHLPDLDFSPYSGLGFRVLFDDGIDSDAGGFYRRWSHYLYLPVGSTERIRLTDNSRLSFNTEFDWLIYGWQVSQLGDVDPFDSDLNNAQHHGYGLRGNLMYEHRSWSVGPFFEYWNIDQSTFACSTLNCGWEPHNQTIEWGLQGKFRF